MQRIGRFLGRFKCDGKMNEDVRPVREPGGGRAEIFDRFGKAADAQIGPTANVSGFAIVGRQLDDLVEPREGLVGLMAGKLDSRNPLTDNGIVGIEVEGAEIFGERLVGLA